jgi:hypothetical protein
MSDGNSTRNRNPHYREHARAAIAIARDGAGPSLEQAIVLERIAVRMHGRANLHELGTWRQDPAAADVELLACTGCGRAARLSRSTGVADVAGILARCEA